MSFGIDLSGKVALVTGASQGIGAQMARTFHSAGAMIVLNHPDMGTTRSDADTVAAELNSGRAGSAHVIAADVSDADAVQIMMQTVRQRCGGLDFLNHH